MLCLSLFPFALPGILLVLASPAQGPLAYPSRASYYDIQAHRGGRGNTVENTLPSFAWYSGINDRARHLSELSAGASLMVLRRSSWITASHWTERSSSGTTKTSELENVSILNLLFSQVPDDPMFPYVGKFIANLTLAQIKMLDCGSLRQKDYPQQLLYPGARIPTLKEVFDFVACADPRHQIAWNIESKIDAHFPNRTVGVQEFVQKQHALFQASPYYRSITYQSFDWRTLIAMKELDPMISISALIEEDTAFSLPDSTAPSPWLAGLRLEEFPGPSFGEQIAQAAYAIGAHILSPTVASMAPSDGSGDRIPFTTKSLVSQAHELGMLVKPWTVNRLDIGDELLAFGADGIITDYPIAVRRWAMQHGLPVAPKYPKQRVLACLEMHMQQR